MRRTDKEITDRVEIDAIVRGCEVCHLALANGDEPYVIPLSYGYDGESLYFHSGREGRKIDFIEKNPRVCFNLVRDVELVKHDTDGCKWTISFESVIGDGVIEELLSPGEKAAGLNWIMRQYSERDWEFDPHVVKQTSVWRLRIESISGKRSQQKSL
ncbi:MAG: pyridoxamine 5'-phosphate oxidase family protein [Phycisphaerales bacterium JB038]